MDDVLAYLSHAMLLIIFLLAAYTRFSNIIINISSVDLVANTEVYLWKDLVTVASYLVIFVVLFAMGCSMFEARDIVNRLREEKTLEMELAAVGANASGRDSGVRTMRERAMDEKTDDALSYNVRDTASDDPSRVAQLEARLEVIAKNIQQGERDSVDLEARVGELENAVGKAESKRDRAIRKLQDTQNAGNDSDSDSSEHHAQIVKMHEIAVQKARDKYTSCRRNLAAAIESVERSRRGLSVLETERSQVQEMLETATRDEESAKHRSAQLAARQPWDCRICHHTCARNFCPECGAAKDPTRQPTDAYPAAPRLTPRLEALEATMEARITAEIERRLQGVPITAENVIVVDDSDDSGDNAEEASRHYRKTDTTEIDLERDPADVSEFPTLPGAKPCE